MILRNAPHARILTTSREPLRLSSERVVRLEPLTPDDAVELFAVRAEAANPRFRRSPDVLPVVADVCRRLDGNALAIELAAARLTVLSVARIRNQLDTRFELLVNGKRDVPPHHRALRASLDWSFGLLTEREGALFAQLGVFAGIFSLDLAVSLCSDNTENDVIEMLDALVEKSLVAAVDDGEAPRFRLLDSVRMYARSRLEEAGLIDAMRSRHLASISAAFGAVADAFAAAPRDSLVLELAPLLDDARVAIDWALRSNHVDVAGGVRILCSTKLWDRLQLGPEALAYADALLARLDPKDIELEAELRRFVSFMDDRWVMSAHGVNAGDRAVALARESANADLLAGALAQRAYVAIRYRRLSEAAHDLDEAEALTPPTAARRLLIVAGRALLANFDGRLDDALRAHVIVLETHRFLGNRTGERYATANIAEVEHLRGETRRAIAILRPFIEGEDGREMHDTMRRNLIGYHLALDEFEAAREHAAEALAQLPRAGNPTAREAMLFGHIALIAAVDGAVVTAAQISAYVDAQLHAHGVPREYTEEVVNDKLRALIDSQLGPAERAAGETEGRSWSRERTVYEAGRITGAPLVRQATAARSAR